MTEKKIGSIKEAETELCQNLSPEALNKLALEADEVTLQLLVQAAIPLSWKETMDNVSRIALSSFVIDHKK